MNWSHYRTPDLALSSWTWLPNDAATSHSHPAPQPPATLYRTAFVSPSLRPQCAPLQPLRQWLNNIEISSEAQARRICQAIPARCPFEREVRVLGKTILRIPPLCKLNPVYEEVVALRFRALCYLADECRVDVTPYC
ncbi:Mo-dependent nitrogenase C-terminal domain-containing protein [Thermoleptolyngbya sichuanensis XZ-Cy5]|uniref:Mo-dependent nitrogenase C-terminal domain-containing protein n=1 Tax=Thermoleptolyngbya sichuanensis TaxID=2885951 RepID=UPI00240D4AE6|nr:Mo-dependent nitrogenase C-terminal domain-containing protein [Thermoleptolyngbya sichuanensis]MDG2615346.1 Mo-dependent nitrogenase C-terminal domain-containing protein [Thermoleptolyngbya sichuanensis XZ-Cy5]